jgi:hypothetical protein
MAKPPLSVRELFARFLDDDSCLAHFATACATPAGSAGRTPRSPRIKGARPSPAPNAAPCADTVLEDSRTSMQLWFYAIFLFVKTHHGVSARELRQSLGVTLKPLGGGPQDS